MSAKPAHYSHNRHSAPIPVRLHLYRAFCQSLHAHLVGRRAAYVIMAALLMALNGCMLEPADGHLVNNTTSPIHFSGYTDQRGEAVIVEYAVGSNWVRLASTNTSSTASLQEGGNEYFSWSTSGQVLPAAAWTPGTTGSFAKVRSRVTRSGSTYNLTSFRTDWSACWANNPDVGRFITACSSSNTPYAYIYTRNYPAGVDLQITALRWTSVGRTEVHVRNSGRHGVVTRLDCSRTGSHSSMSISDIIAPGETRTYRSAVAPIGRVTCAVTGTNSDGSPELNTANNTRSQSF